MRLSIRLLVRKQTRNRALFSFSLRLLVVGSGRSLRLTRLQLWPEEERRYLSGARRYFVGLSAFTNCKVRLVRIRDLGGTKDLPKFRQILGRGWLCTTFAVLLCASLAGCRLSPSTYPPIRYRLMAEVETPQGLKTFSRVQEVTYSRPPRGYAMRGEAVPIALLPGKTAFMTLRSETHVDWLADAILAFQWSGKADEDKPVMPADSDAYHERRFSEIRDSRRLNVIWQRNGNGGKVPPSSPGPPMLVYFEDIADPRTVRQLKPGEFDTYFGKGFDLVSIKVVGTDEDVNLTILDRLPWIATLQGAVDLENIRGKPLSEIPPEKLLSATAFILDQKP